MLMLLLLHTTASMLMYLVVVVERVNCHASIHTAKGGDPIGKHHRTTDATPESQYTRTLHTTTMTITNGTDGYHVLLFVVFEMAEID